MPAFALVLAFVAVAGTMGTVWASPARAASDRTPVAAPVHPLATTSAAPNVISLIPEPASVPSWCGQANTTDRYTSDSAGFLSLQSNLFNLTSGSTGGSTLCYDNATGTVSDQIVTSTPGAHIGKVIGFPAAVLGQNIYGGTSGLTDPALPLPDVQVRNLTSESLWSAVNYSVTEEGGTEYNFAFDDWLTPIEANATLGRDPGDRIEVMVWFSDDLNRSWVKHGQTDVALGSFVNGSADPYSWLRDQWCENASQITFDYYFTDHANTSSSNITGLPSALIAVNMSQVFANVESYVDSEGACWAPAGTNISSYYVDEFPLGIEFYPPKSSGDEDEAVSWSANTWCYTTLNGTATANEVDCHPTGGSTVTPLTPSASANVTSGLEPLDVNFSGSATGGEPPYDYIWSFGSGLGTRSAQATNYTYWQPGTYEVNVTVVDYNDIAVSPDLTITVEPVHNLTVELRASPSNVTTGTAVTLSATVAGGRTPYTYQWWGLPNGTGCQSADQANLTCAPEANGTWTIIVGVSDPGGYAQASANLTASSPANSTRTPTPPGSTGPSPSGAGSSITSEEIAYALIGVIVVVAILASLVLFVRRARRAGGTPPTPPTGGPPS